MGKLSDLWAELKTTQNDVRKRDLQKEITRIEKWMIGNKLKEPGTETNWSKSRKEPSTGGCIHSSLDKKTCYFCKSNAFFSVILDDKCKVPACGNCLKQVESDRKLAKERGFYKPTLQV